MKGKNKCKILKQIRKKIADENDIPYVTRECGYKGDCSGTCPKCEAELQYLERELEKRRRLGKTAVVAAVAAGLSLSLAACTPGGGKGPTDYLTDSSYTLPQPTSQPSPQETEDQPVTVEGKIECTEPTAEVPELLGELAVLPTQTEPYELEGDVACLPETSEELPTEVR